MSTAHRYVVLQFVLFGCLVVSVWTTTSQSTSLARTVGYGLVLVGLLLALWAIASFQRYARTLPQVSPEATRGAQLVQQGIYGVIRHPIYSGVLLACLGMALGHGHVVTWLIALLIVLFFSFKSRFEESRLRLVYPEYSDYMRRTGRFLPYINW
jgi:protein-S-isoprenylcysteine O-methyltransferase Ste14